ncbi:DNA polymerase IV [Panacagrimonas sp.]|uniref:DNA polymerase IV n=1 Tax=Panacagrimonas sp. TaxID=2480088 RepID=UPI003B5224E7
MRKIVHVDLDAFYASVEQRDDPALRGRPVVVAWRGARSVVCAASYEARKFGIRSAMPALRAERLCPEAVFVPPDFSRYREASRAVREIFERHTRVIEPLSLDEAYLDVSENLTGLPTATAVAEKIRAQIHAELRLTASAGVAPNKFLAKLASDWNKPDGLFVIRPKRAQALIAPLPVGRIPGVGPVLEKKLATLGIFLIADLRAADLALLQDRFGKYGQRLHELSLGIDERPVSAERERVSVSAEDTFPADLSLDELPPHVRRMADRTWAAAAKLGKPAYTVVLKLKTSEFRTLTRSWTGEAALSSSGMLADRAVDLLARVNLPPATRFRLVGVGASNFRDPEADAQRSLI